MIQVVATRFLAAVPQVTALCMACACAVSAHAAYVPPFGSCEANQPDAPNGQQPAGKIDNQAPFLQSIGTSGSINAQDSTQSVLVDLDIKDDLSGVAKYCIEYASPSGQQHTSRWRIVADPLLHVTPTLTVGSYPYIDPGFTAFTEPGVWRASAFLVYDARGNERTYSTSNLQNLGSITFNVTNNGGYDIEPPAFASGSISTPTIRRSKAPKGTPAGTPPYASADLSVTDSGNGRVSGTYEGDLQMCHLTNGSCDDYFTLVGTTNQAGELANTLTTGTQIRQDQTLGQYVIVTLDLYDVAQNHIQYLSSQFGGGTNFNALFPRGATIFVNQ